MRRISNDHKILLVILALTYIPFLWHYGVRLGRVQPMDFPSFYWAADLAFNAGRSPYGADAFAEAITQTGQHIFPYYYPPPCLLFFYPLSVLTYPQAKAALIIANHISLLGVIFLLITRILPSGLGRPLPTLEVLVSVVYIFAFHPLLVTLHVGQINLLVLILLCLFWEAMKSNRSPALIAAALAGAIVLKTYPAILLLLLVVKRRYRVTLWVFGFLSFAALVSFLVLPPSVWSDWLVQILPSGGYGQIPLGFVSPASPWNQSINGFTSRLFLENEYTSTLWASARAARIVPYLLAACVTCATVVMLYRTSRRHGDRLIDLELSLLLVTMCLVSPLTWEHHLVLILPAILVAFTRIFFPWQGRALPLLVGLAALGMAWRLPFESLRLREGLLTFAISELLYALVILWVVLFVELGRAPGRREDLEKQV